MRWPALLLLASTACASVAGAMRDQAGDLSRLGHAHFDSKASELTANWFDSTVCCGSGEPEKFRDELTDSFNGLLAGANAAPARYRAKVTVTHAGVPGFFPCLAVLTLVGCPVGYASAMVELEVDLGGRRYLGKGEASRWNFLYYWPSAIGEAFGQALRNAKEAGPRR